MLFDVIVIALIALSAFLGYKKGFIKTVSKLLCFVISIILAKLLHPVISGVVRNSFIGNFINSKIAEKSVITEDMPSFVQKAGETTVNGLTDAVVGIVTVIIIMIVVFFAANAAVNAINLVAKLPFISSINRTFGIISGLLMGILLVYLVLAVVLVANVEATWLDDSLLAQFMFRHNLLMNLIF